MRTKMPPLNALRSFEAAARHCSFKNAAEELGVSHSAISHQVKLLEEYLGVELFTRKSRAVELTRTGQAYYPVLREAFDDILEATERILAPHSPSIITVQLYSTLAVRWLIPRLPGFSEAHPDIQVRLNTSQTDVDFDHDDVDACIRIGRSPAEGLNHRYLFSSELFPVASPALAAGDHPIRTPGDLEQKSLLQVYPSSNDWGIWLDAHGLGHVNPDAGLQFDSYDHALAMAVQGLGVALAMKPYVQRDLDAGTLVELFPGERTPHVDDWYFVCRKGREKTAKIAAFSEWLAALIAQDTDLFN